MALEDAHAQMYHVVQGHAQAQILIEFLKSYRQTYTHFPRYDAGFVAERCHGDLIPPQISYPPGTKTPVKWYLRVSFHQPVLQRHGGLILLVK